MENQENLVLVDKKLLEELLERLSSIERKIDGVDNLVCAIVDKLGCA